MKKLRMCAVLLVSTLLAACSPAATQVQKTESAASAPAETTTAETTVSYDPGLPDADYKGAGFTFAVRGKEGAAGAFADLTAAETNGDALNDAIFDRTRYIEETYNVKIKSRFCGSTTTATTGSEMSNAVSASVLSGDKELDAISSAPYDSIGYATQGWVLDLGGLEHLDLTHPWWDQNAVRELSIFGTIYFTTGEYTVWDNRTTMVMLFVKDLVRDLSLDDPYKLVREGKWTLDAFTKMARAVSADLNGDGVMNEADRYGYTAWQDGVFGFIHSTGNSFGALNAKGEPELTFYTDRMTSSWSKLIAFTQDKSFFSGNRDLALLKGTAADDVFMYMLNSKHTLFNYGNIQTVEYLRTMETNFGIIPNPKLDEKQESYFATASGWNTALLSVPVTTPDPARTGLILEAFAAKSMEVVTPAFYEKTVLGKSTRDDESEEMLDIIFASKKYDIGYYFMWGNMTNLMMQAWNDKNENLASIYESAKSAAEADVKTTIDTVFVK